MRYGGPPCTPVVPYFLVHRSLCFCPCPNVVWPCLAIVCRCLAVVLSTYVCCLSMPCSCFVCALQFLSKPCSCLYVWRLVLSSLTTKCSTCTAYRFPRYRLSCKILTRYIIYNNFPLWFTVNEFSWEWQRLQSNNRTSFFFFVSIHCRWCPLVLVNSLLSTSLFLVTILWHFNAWSVLLRHLGTSS